MINNLNQSIRYSEFHVNMRYNLQQVQASVQGVLVPSFTENFVKKYSFQLSNWSSSELKIGTTSQFLWKFLKSSEQLFHGHATSYYVMSWSVLLITRLFNQYFFRWRHRGMISGRLFNNILSGSGSFLKKLHFFGIGVL